ncbi:MAG: hypothetical protein ACLTDI_13515 [Acutalibacteraceae bacterium]
MGIISHVGELKEQNPAPDCCGEGQDRRKQGYILNCDGTMAALWGNHGNMMAKPWRHQENRFAGIEHG